MNQQIAPSGFLGDTAARDYTRKLRLFSAFAKPEICEAMAILGLQTGMRVLDAGCGTGEMSDWLSARVQPDGLVVGMDLASAHIAGARALLNQSALLVQADLLAAPFMHASFDVIWSSNVIHHLREPSAGLQTLAGLLRPGGRIAIGQSSFLPDMYFAWNARLEHAVNEAVRGYYRDRYQVSEDELRAIRATVGLLRQCGWRHVRARTFMIERVTPLTLEDELYLTEVIFRHTWGARLQPYLSKADYEELSKLCDPCHPEFALRRPDFHFLQTFTLVVGEI